MNDTKTAVEVLLTKGDRVTITGPSRFQGRSGVITTLLDGGKWYAVRVEDKALITGPFKLSELRRTRKAGGHGHA